MAKSTFLSREPVLKTAEFMGRSDALTWLSDMLGGEYPKNCNIVGEPRVGKTSLLHYVYRERLGLAAKQTGVYVWLALAELPAHTPADFWGRLLKRLYADGVDLLPVREATGWPTDHHDCYDEVVEAIEELVEGGHRLILLIDDFDLLVDHITGYDLDWLRSLSTQYRQHLAFVIASLDSLPKLVDKIQAGPASEPSPLPNTFHVLTLGLLTLNAARSLCQQAAAAEGLPELSQAEIAFLLREAGYHPDLLKLACGYLFAAKVKTANSDLAELAGAVQSRFRFDDNVRTLCQLLYERCEPEAQAILQAIVLGRPLGSDETLRRRLQFEMRLIMAEDGRYRLFSDAFAYWLRRHLQRQSRQPQPETTVPQTIPAPDFVHKPEQRLVQVDGQTVELTPLDNRLLAYLLAHHDQVCTTEALLHHVWQPDRSPAVVEKGINRLRSKIEQDPKRPRYIISIRGEGYLLRLS